MIFVVYLQWQQNPLPTSEIFFPSCTGGFGATLKLTVAKWYVCWSADLYRAHDCVLKVVFPEVSLA